MQRRRDEERGSSMRTLFEFRGRPWFVRALLLLTVAGVAYAITRHFV